MYFTYDPTKSIHVAEPYQRTLTPYMMPDTASCPINFSVHLTEWAPGSQVDEHLHPGAMEAMYCLSGHGTASVEDQIYDLTPDAMIVAAPGQLHCIKNTGDIPLGCLCIFSPPTTAEELDRRAAEAVKASKTSETR